MRFFLALNILFALLFQTTFGQKEYHFYSDQPETKRNRTVPNEFKYSFTQINDELYINLKVALKKKIYDVAKPVTFFATVSQNGRPSSEQTITDGYYDFDGIYYSFKIPVNITKIDTATIFIRNTSPELIGNTDFKIVFVSDKNNTTPVYIYDQDLKPVITDKTLERQSIVPITPNGKVFVKFLDYDLRIPNSPYNIRYNPMKYEYQNSIINSETSFILEKTGQYLFSADSIYSNPRKLIVTKNAFPKYNTPDLLLKAAIYLSDSTLIKTVNIPKPHKSDLDDFWYSFVGNKNKAKSIIKSYYKRVYNANDAFTDKIIGWKTDMGMAYILLGTPSKINTTQEGKVIWVYNNDEIHFIKDTEGVFVFENYEKARIATLKGIEKIKKDEITDDGFWR